MPSLSVATAQDFIREIAVKTSDGKGRQAHAFSVKENEAFIFAMSEARRHLTEAGKVENRDFRVDTDAVGNVLVTVYGKDRSKTVIAGSHLDSVQDGGNHDGVDGVASGMAYLQRFARSKQPKTNYTLAVWRSEESSPMTGEPMLGSKIITSTISAERLNAVTYGLSQNSRKLLSEHFGPEKWDAIIAEHANPWVKQGTLYLPKQGHGGSGAHDMEAIAYNELHIEQSAVLQNGNFDVGIVSHIGGSTNRQFSLDSSHVPYETKDTHTTPRAVWTFTFHGEADHTGGTPHNEYESVHNKETWYRKDALIGASTFLQDALMASEVDFDVASVGIPKETGYTTVPAIQTVVIHAPLAKSSSVFHCLNQIAARAAHTKGLTVTIASHVESSKPVTLMNKQSLQRLIQIPLIIEKSARETSNKYRTLFGGPVRATAIDGSLNEQGMRMKLNVRDIDPAKRDELMSEIERYVRATGIDAEAFFGKKATPTEHMPLDGHMITVAEDAAEQLGKRYLTMPSMPGHDAGSIQKAGVGTGMIYERHNGKSHIPTESVEPHHQESGIAVHHATLDHYTFRRD